MSIFRKGQHAELLTETRPIPSDNTSPLPNCSLLEGPEPVTKTFASPIPAPLPEPVQGPASLPPLPQRKPAPAPRHRLGWVPAPAPRMPAPVRITEPAALAAEIAATHPGIFALPCGTCHRVHARGGTASFRALYAEAGRAGWRKDTLGKWACPACQAKPGWRAPSIPALAGEYLEYALARDVAAHAAAEPLLDTFAHAQRKPRYYLNVSALATATPADIEDTDEETAMAGDAT